MITMLLTGVYLIGRALWALVKIMFMVVAFLVVAAGLLGQFAWIKSKPYARRAWTAVRGEFTYG